MSNLMSLCKSCHSRITAESGDRWGYYSLPSAGWSEDIIAGKTAVKNWPFHIMELRKAIESVITTINSFDSSTTFDIPPITWLPIGTGRPRADVMQQFQNLILML